MSPSTVRIYKYMFSVFLSKFQNEDLNMISKKQIEGFVYQLIKENQINESFQNQLINSIKAYYEYILEKPREYYEIKRPNKSITIPNVSSEEEVLKLFNTPKTENTEPYYRPYTVPA